MDLIAASDRALVDGMRVMASWQDDGTTHETRAAFYARQKSRFPTPFSNVAWPLADSAETVLDEIDRVFEDRSFFVWVPERLSASFERTGAERGMVVQPPLPGMIIEGRVPYAPGAHLEVARVSNAQEISRAATLLAAAYAEEGLPEPIAHRQFINTDGVLGPNVSFALASLGATPIAAAIAILCDDVAGVFWVGTHPSARRQGGADAVTRLVTNDAFDRGARVVCLQASAAGEPVYRRMGYRTVTQYSRLFRRRSR